MNLNLNEEEIQYIMGETDKNNNGIIEYKEFLNIGVEFIFGWFLKN